MAALGTVTAVAQNLSEALQSSYLKEILSITSSESELEDLQNTVSTIRTVFHNLEMKHNFLTEHTKMIQELKDAVFESRIVVDDFVTLAQQTLSQKKRSFFSLSEKIRSFLHFGAAYKISKGVKEIRKKLDAIVGNYRFNFVPYPEPIRNRRPETCSYVNEVDIIGRGEDLEKIVSKLLDPDVEQNVSFLSIVGIGGIGKTALAQLVFNDPRVSSEFSLRMWTTTVSDISMNHLEVEEILRKILSTVTGLKSSCSTMDVQRELRQRLEDNKYLLVLDDVWTENREEWCRLAKYFVGSQRGSWVVVTTRSQRTATIIQDSQLYELQALSNENSWRLFSRIAYGLEDYSCITPELIQIGKELADRCAGNPLVLRVVGSLLYGQDKSKWLSVRQIGFEKVIMSEEEVLFSIFKQSYDYLESALKVCFIYCALFPKDFTLNKDMLISLWIAQDYIKPINAELSIEDVGDEYFSTLLEKYFFKDIKNDKYGEIVSCKMQDLISFLAQHLAKKEMYIMSDFCIELDVRVHHVSVLDWKFVGNGDLGNSNILSYLHVGYNENQLCNLSHVTKSSLELLLAN